jgi:hypothetical protein
MSIWSNKDIQNLPGTTVPRKIVATSVVFNATTATINFKVTNYNGNDPISVGILAATNSVRLTVDNSIMHNTSTGAVSTEGTIGTFNFIKDLLSNPGAISINTVLNNWLDKKITDGVFNS